MKARQALNTALVLLGYTDKDGNEQLTRRVINKALAVINTVYEDLWSIVTAADFVPAGGLEDEIKLTDRALAALPYGIAAFLAQSENDGDQQQLWMSVYNKKRAGLTNHTAVKNKMPGSWDI